MVKARDTIAFAHMMGFEVSQNPDVMTFKRDYVYMHDLTDAKTVMQFIASSVLTL